MSYGGGTSVIVQNKQQVLKDKEDLRAITLKLQSLLEEKKKAHARVKFLESRLDLVERENQIKMKQVKHDLNQKIEELRRLLKMTEGKLKTTNSRCTTYISKLSQSESKYNDVRRERENYAAQLSQAETNLADSKNENGKLQALVRRLEREKKGLSDKLEIERSAKKSLQQHNRELEAKIKQLTKELSIHQSTIDELNTRMSRLGESAAVEERARQQAFNKKQEDLRKSFKAKLDEFCTLKNSQYNKDKKNWMEIFRNEVETKMRGLKEDNQSYTHTIKVLEEEAERLRKALAIAERDCENAKQGEARSVQMKEHLQRQLLELQDKTRDRIEKLEREIRRLSRENEKMKKVLLLKDAKIAELEREHCDYFAEITALQKVVADAENMRSPTSTPSMADTILRHSSSSSSSSSMSGSRMGGFASTGLMKSSSMSGSSRNGLMGVIKSSSSMSSRSGFKSNLTGSRGLFSRNDSSGSSGISRKRRRLDDAGRAAEVVAVGTSSPDSHLTFSGVNEDDGYIVIKNGDKRVSLDGFYLTTKSNPDMRKNLPDRTLEAGEELRVWTSVSPNGKLGDVVWQDFTAEEGQDTCLLYDVKEELHASYPYRVESVNANCFIM